MKYNDVKEFTIKRSEWYRGKGYLHSKLLDDCGLKCCLGFFALECGLSKEEILDIEEPAQLLSKDEDSKLIEWETFLVDELGSNTSDCSSLMLINDSKVSSDKEKEDSIIRIFNNKGIKVSFVD